MSGAEPGPCARWRATLEAAEASGRPLSPVEVDAARYWSSCAVGEASWRLRYRWLPRDSAAAAELSPALHSDGIGFSLAVAAGDCAGALRYLAKIESLALERWGDE